MKILLALALTALALPAQDGPMPPRSGRRFAEPGPARMERFQERIRAWRMERIVHTLHLSEDRARAIADRWSAFDREFLERGGQIKQLRERFNEVLLGPGSEEEKNARLKPMLEQYLGLRRQQMELKGRFEDDVRAQLTPAQQVRFILLVEDLQRHLRESLAETMGGDRPRRMRP